MLPPRRLEEKIEEKNVGRLTRRDCLRLGLAGAVLSWLNGRCAKSSEPKSPFGPIVPGPVYELTDGRSLYDDFDGNGGFQTFDNTNLAVAGQLSHNLWVPGDTDEVVDNPVAKGLFTVVDEKGQRVEYRVAEQEVQHIITYLAENPRPVTTFEREVLEGLLNDRGKIVVSDIEAKEIEKQVKVIGCVLNNRTELFNERGRKLIKIISDKSPSAPSLERLEELAREGFDETELFVLGQLMAERQMYESIQSSPLRQALKGGGNIVRAAIGRTTELQEIKYVYDAEGKLVDAVPHIPGTPYDGSSELLWIGAKSGAIESENGPVLVEKGKVYGKAEIVPAGASGHVLKMTNRLLDFSPSNFVFLMLDNPTMIEFLDVRTFSADVLLSSLSAGPALSAKLDYHTTIPEQPPGASWATSIGIRRDIEGEIYLFAQAYNVNTDYRYKEFLGYAQLDRWYNLRLDIITRRDDSRLGDREFRIDFYVDGLLLASEIPIDAEILIDPKRTGGGPNRSLILSKEHEGGDCIAFFDNIRGAYNNRTS